MVFVRLLAVLLLSAHGAAQAEAPPINPLRASGPVGMPAPAETAASESVPAPEVNESSLLELHPAAPMPRPTFASKPHSSAPSDSGQDDPRRLARPSEIKRPASISERPRLLNISWSELPLSPATTGTALAFVVGLFFLFAGIVKRATPKSQRLLPADVASVLGRISLGGKQSAHLLKVGAKLVLVQITPEGAKPLTEVTEPDEVNRLLGLCEQGGDHSASAEFQDVFEKLTAEPAGPGFLGGEATLFNRQQLAAAYANTPGGRGSA